MSWLLNLHRTYEANHAFVGKIARKHNEQEYTLLPVSHTTQNAHIEVEITEDGAFHSATVVDKNDASTLIPCTEDSASRAGAKIAPYPLHDKLSYVAGDYVAYGGEIKNEAPFTYYIQQLEQWANSPHAVDKIQSIYAYLRKGCLIRDLVEAKVLWTDAGNRLITKWDKEAEAQYGSSRPPIYGVLAGDPYAAFVRFNVRSISGDLTKVWKDQAVYDSFVGFYASRLGDEELCYVSGRVLPGTDKHANKIRNAADKAKLISANDTSGFTFRGRFNLGTEAAAISYDVSQKAHNALKWLINRQGIVYDLRVFLVWGNRELDVPGPLDDSFEINPSAVAAPEQIAFTQEQFAGEVSKALAGYRNRLGRKSEANVNILVLDSATTGRLAVLYYRDLDKELYLDKLVRWHSTCTWLHRYRKNEDGEFVAFHGAPATKDIAFAAYGPRANEKVVKGLMERMLPCIVDERDIPADIVTSVFHRASNPAGMEKWEWEKTLSIACAIWNRREGKTVALDKENRQRDYLFGRMLAVADVLERRALGKEETRATNAIRYMNAFARHPQRTWSTIQSSLQPYQAKLGLKATYWTKIIDDIASRFAVEDFSNKPLSGLYLLGFYSQRHDLYQKKDDQEAADAADEDE